LQGFQDRHLRTRYYLCNCVCACSSVSVCLFVCVCVCVCVCCTGSTGHLQRFQDRHLLSHCYYFVVALCHTPITLVYYCGYTFVTLFLHFSIECWGVAVFVWMCACLLMCVRVIQNIPSKRAKFTNFT
jgi:hypothetical protein